MSIITDFSGQNADLAGNILENASELFKSVRGISTGYPLLDSLTKGLLPQHTIVLGTETGFGKSVFTINILVNIARSKTAKSLYIDLENGSNATGKRFLMITGNKTAEFFEDEQSNIGEVEKITEKLKGWIFYKNHVQLEPQLRNTDSLAKAKVIGSIIEDFVTKENVKIVVVDPLEEFELVTKDAGQGFNAIQTVVALFRDLAQKYSITIILIHHLKKPGNDSLQVKSLDENVAPKYRIPTIHDFIGSSKIVNTATDVWSFVRQIHAPDKFEQGKTLFRILKARETSLGDVRFQMDLETLRFSEVSGYQFKQEVGEAEKPKQEKQENFIKKLEADYKKDQEQQKLADWEEKAKSSEEDKHE